MVHLLLVIALAAATLTAADEPLRIRVAGRAIFAGGDQRVTCSVARNPKNRLLRLGVEAERSSDVDLTTNAWVTHELWVKKVTCSAGPAFCEVTDKDGKRTRREQDFRVLGCPGEGSGFPEE